MKIGSLVKITRASIGIPEGTIGLIIEIVPARAETFPASELTYHIVELIGMGRRAPRRYLPEDLEVLS